MTEGSPFRMDTAATARPVAIPCMAGHCLFQALDAFTGLRKGEGGAAFPSVISPQPAWGKTSRLCLLPCAAGGHGGEDGPRGDKRNGRTRKDGREDGQDACRYIERDRPMQETAIADGVANGFPLKGIGIRFLGTHSPYKKMSSWG